MHFHTQLQDFLSRDSYPILIELPIALSEGAYNSIVSSYLFIASPGFTVHLTLAIVINILLSVGYQQTLTALVLSWTLASAGLQPLFSYTISNILPMFVSAMLIFTSARTLLLRLRWLPPLLPITSFALWALWLVGFACIFIRIQSLVVKISLGCILCFITLTMLIGYTSKSDQDSQKEHEKQRETFTVAASFLTIFHYTIILFLSWVFIKVLRAPGVEIGRCANKSSKAGVKRRVEGRDSF